MHWLSLVVGLLIGWLVEWLIDVFYWRRRSAAAGHVEAELRAEIERLRAEAAGHAGVVAQLRACEEEAANRAGASEPVHALAAQHEAEIERLRRELAGRDELAARLNADLAAARSAGKAPFLPGTPESSSFPQVDLAEGDVPDSSLQEATFLGGSLADVSRPEFAVPEPTLPEVDLPEDSLHADAQAAGSAISDARTEPLGFAALPATDAAADASSTVLPAQQAGAAFADTAGATGPERDDDLEIIEGIGPAIAALLRANGVTSFARLAAMDVPGLQAILRSGGSRFQVANPGSWAEQAALAAAGAWDELKQLQARLSAGISKKQP